MESFPVTDSISRDNREYRDRLEGKIGFLDLAVDFNTRGHRRGRDRRTGPMPRIASPLPCWCPLRFITSLFIDVTDGTFYHYNSRKASSLASPLSPILDAFPPTSTALVELMSSVLILDPSFLPLQTTLFEEYARAMKKILRLNDDSYIKIFFPTNSPERG
ncbi:hypothetical protein V1478_013850 [Vespula squamosa]|uniref:Uncharacterized protein n=1 Tax=Vespula squamosa TaxID=30214 RepID=A0ABD2A6C3_VESSQ